MINLLITSVLLFAAEGDDAAKKDLAAMQGAWTVVAFERGGKAAPDDLVKSMRVTVKDDVLTLGDGKRDEPVTFRLDPSRKPKALDMLPRKRTDKVKDGGEVKAPDETILAIYEINGDDLKICWRKEGKNAPKRPAEFETRSDSDLGLLILKGEKK